MIYRSNRALRVGFFALMALWLYRCLFMEFVVFHPGDVQVLVHNALHAYILLSLLLAIWLLSQTPALLMQGHRAMVGMVYMTGIVAGFSLY